MRTSVENKPSVSMLAQLLQAGKALHGNALRVYSEVFPQDVWELPILSRPEVTEPGNYGYSDVLGLNCLREALAARDRSTRSLPFLSPDNIAVTQGGTHAIHAVLQAFAGPKTTVLIPSPSYAGYRDICKLLRLKHSPYRMDDSGDWLTDEILQSLRPSSLMIVNSPHNPSGAQIQTGQLRRLVRAAKQSGAGVLFDCVYDELVYEDSVPQWQSAFPSAADLDGFIWINSFSKNYGLPGLRLGWITATAQAIATLEPVIECNILCLPAFNQKAASLALGNMAGKLTHAMRVRRDYLCRRLAEIEELEFRRPTAGLIVMARLRQGRALDLVKRLLRDEALLLLPGEAYYGGDTHTLRLSFGYTCADIERYTSTLATVLRRHQQVFSSAVCPQRMPFVSVERLSTPYQNQIQTAKLEPR